MKETMLADVFIGQINDVKWIVEVDEMRDLLAKACSGKFGISCAI